MHIFTSIAFSGKTLKDLISQLFLLESGTLTLQPCLNCVNGKGACCVLTMEIALSRIAFFLSM